ncbi:hypothetical protein [Leptospira meyeri]|uniref:hypothetical protein n=1 Tax=Leptospira meyeri TaxID=29508 RepID=UPI001083B3F8|nr:hypothetical protein [Leptospira meyeri]TGM21608.1 hypothetical protein EHQ73_09865 [Leptospira meyeri]
MNHKKKSLALFILTMAATSVFSKESSRAKAIAFIEVANAMNIPAAYLSLDDRLKQKVGFDELNFLLFERSKFMRNQSLKKVLIEEKGIRYNAGESIQSYKFKSTSDKENTIIDEVIVDSKNNLISYEVKLYNPDDPLDEAKFRLPNVDENEEIQISEYLNEFNKIQETLDKNKYYRIGSHFFYKPEKRGNFTSGLDIQKVKNDLGIYRKGSFEFLNSEAIKYRINKSKILNQTYDCANKAKVFYFLVEIKSEKTFIKILRAYEFKNNNIRFYWTQYTEEMLNRDSFVDMIKDEC